MARLPELLVATAVGKPLLSSEHFWVAGTLLRTWASHRSLERIIGIGDDPTRPSGGHGDGSAPAKDK